MQDLADRLAALRRSLNASALAHESARTRQPLGHAGADRRLGGGLLRGTLHEVFAQDGHAAAASGFAAALAQLICGQRCVFWIRQDYSALERGEIYAGGLLELGFDPAQVLLLRVGNAQEALRASADALSCAALGALIVEIDGDPKILDLTASRRLTLAAAQKGVTVFLLRLHANADASAAETRWRIRGACSAAENENWGMPVFEAQLARNRHGQTGQWVLEWSSDDGAFREPAHPGAVVRAPADGSSAAPHETAA